MDRFSIPDACWAPPARPLVIAPPAVLGRPHETFIRQADAPADPALLKRRDFLRAIQNSQNQACQADPVAAELNGHYQVGSQGDWVKTGPSLLELAAGLTPYKKAIDLTITGLKTGIKVHEFLVDHASSAM